MRSALWLSVTWGQLASVVVLCTLAAGAAAAAQETGGSIASTIADAQGAAMPGVTVSLRNEGTNAQLNTVTNSDGNHVLPFVPFGRSTLTATLTGFSTTKREGTSRCASAIGCGSTWRCSSGR